MSQTTSNAKAKASKAGNEAAGVFDAFQVNMPNLEVPAAFREAAEKTAEQAKDAFAKIKLATEEAGEVAEETFESAKDHALAVTLKALEIAKTNTDASFDFFKNYFGAKTLADAVEAQTAFARKQFEVLGGQVKDLQEAAQKAAVEVAKPSRNALEKAFKDIKAA